MSIESVVRAAAAAKSLQSCTTLCDPIDSSPLGSPVPGILQARTLEWVAISFSNAWMWKVKVKSLSRVRLLATPWTAAYQAPPSMGFSRQEYRSGLVVRAKTPQLDGIFKILTKPQNFKYNYTWGGNGNPLQCSCLENPRDRGAWWAAVNGVAQSRTQLKRLSSSSSSRHEEEPN